MKKRFVLISMILALTMVMLVPSSALASAPPGTSFSASGFITAIDTGNVRPLGDSGKWLVRDRHIEGQFLPNSSLSGSFTITYGGVFDLASQAGHLIGTMNTGSGFFFLSGEVAPLTFLPNGLPVLTLSGHWMGLSGVRATGTFKGYVVFIPDDAGHVLYIVDSALSMAGNSISRR